MNDALRGHDIRDDGGVLVFADTGLSTVDTWRNRPCGFCDRHNTPEGHDACLGTLENVINACCGHGVVNDAYVQFDDESIIRGVDAVVLFEMCAVV